MEKPNWETKQNIKKFQNKKHVAQEVLNQKTHELETINKTLRDTRVLNKLPAEKKRRLVIKQINILESQIATFGERIESLNEQKYQWLRFKTWSYLRFDDKVVYSNVQQKQ